MKNIMLCTVALISFAGNAFATSMEDKIQEIEERYASEFSALEEAGNDIAADAPRPSEIEAVVGATFEVDWDMTAIKFDIPEILMKTREFKLHLPQFRMKRTSVKWDNPEFHNAITKVGEYPCFKGWKWYSCDIKTKVPQVRMVRREAKFDVPEVFWDMTGFKMDIPEVFSKRVEIKLHLPQFATKSVSGEFRKTEEAAKALTTKAEMLAQKQKSEIAEIVHADLIQKRQDVAAQFDEAIESLEAAIKKVKAAGADPASLNGVNLVAQLSDLLVKRDEALAIFSAKISEFA